MGLAASRVYDFMDELSQQAQTRWADEIMDEDASKEQFASY